MNKPKLVERILKITKKEGNSEVFDLLIEKPESYLNTLYVVIKGLKK